MSENATPRTDAARERQRKYWEAINEAARGPYGVTTVTPDPDAPEDGWSHSQRIERELTAANARIAELEKDAARAQMRIDAFMRQQPVYDSALACAATVATALKKQGYRLCDCGAAPQGMCCCATTVTGPKP